MEKVIGEENQFEKDDSNFSLFASAVSRKRLDGAEKKRLQATNMLGPARYKPKFNTVMRKAPQHGFSKLDRQSMITSSLEIEREEFEPMICSNHVRKFSSKRLPAISSKRKLMQSAVSNLVEDENSGGLRSPTLSNHSSCPRLVGSQVSQRGHQIYNSVQVNRISDWSKQPTLKQPVFMNKRDKDFNTKTFYDCDNLSGQKPKNVPAWVKQVGRHQKFK